MKNLFVLLLWCGLCGPAFAQDSLRQQYDRRTLYMQGNDRLYVMGRRQQLAGLGGGQLRREFEAFPEPLALYDRSRKLRMVSSGLSLAATAISLVTLVNICLLYTSPSPRD